MERHLEASVDLDHRQVVDLADMGDGERCSEDALAECRVRAARLDMDDDVDPRQRVVQGLLDAIRGRVALADRRARRDADDDVGEVLASGSAAAAAGGARPEDRGVRSPVARVAHRPRASDP